MSYLFQCKNIANVSLKNRIIMAPMCMYKSDENGVINPFHKYHYVSKALAGVGLIIVEATAIEPKGRISSKDLGLWNDEQITAHKELTKDCHFFGSKIAIQLAHAGRKCTVENLTPIAPSAIAFSNEAPFKEPKKASLEDITNIKKLFLNMAIRAQKADYDMLELHAAHGYLLCEFLSPLTNKRDDIYGGSIENRCRLVLEIAKELKEKVDLPLIVRISADEWMKDGWNINDSVYLSKKLEEIGVDAIHVSSGGNQANPDKAFELKPLYQSDFAKEIKEAISIPVIAVGLITTAKEGEFLLKNSYCDFVAYGREFLRNPNFVFTAASELNNKDVINSSYQRAF
jgi:NADPH2 dehydrogenase